MEQLPPIIIDEKTFLYDHCSLPPLPDIVTRLREVIQSHDVNVSNVAELIDKDPALVAQILKIVNSAYYSIPRQISDIKFAVAYLGIHEIYRTVLPLSVINNLNIGSSKHFISLWYHSNFAALCAKYLAKKYAPLLAHEKLWPAALLHDIGKLVYIKFFPNHFNLLSQYCKTNGELFSNAEDYYNLPKSSWIGTLLCRKWRLPKTIEEACASHDFDQLEKNNRKCLSEDFASIITIGNYIAILANEEINTKIKEKIVTEIKSFIQISQKEFLSMMGEIYDLKYEVDRLI